MEKTRVSRRSKSGYGNKTSKSKQLTNFAYSMGQIDRGLKNPESRITSSYQAGQKRADYKKKPLF